MVRTRLSAGGQPYPQVNDEARTLGEAGHRVIFLGWDRSGKYKYTKMTDWGWVERYPVSCSVEDSLSEDGFVRYVPGFQMWVAKRIWRLYKRKGFTDMAIHAHDLDVLPVCVMMSKLLDVPLVYEAHENYGGMVQATVGDTAVQILTKLEIFLLRFCEGIIGSGPPVYGWLMTLLAHDSGYNKLRKLLFNPAPVEPIEKIVMQAFELPERLLCNSRITMISNAKRLEDFPFGLGLEPPTMQVPGLKLLYIGVFEEKLHRKLRQIIDVVTQVEGVSFLIGGYGAFAPEIDKLSQKHENIHFLGAIDPNEVPMYTTAADAIVRIADPANRNNYYATPNALFAAMAGGTSLLTNEEGIVGHIVKEHGIGFTVPFGRWEILKQTIEEMRDNPDKVYQCGKNGRLLAEKKHNWSYNAQRLKALYKNRIQKYEYYY
jgi:glycosyltransferase involved in cell wall biosynthesis